LSVTDPLADMLTRIRNANIAKLEATDIPSSKLKLRVAQLLKQEGYLKDYKLIEDNRQGVLRVYLKYGPEGREFIEGIKRISKPSRRVYVKKEQIPKVLGGLGIAIISTSKGIVTDSEAKKLNLGGELLCTVW
jgi:small subunit ribosomal protein S8